MSLRKITYVLILSLSCNFLLATDEDTITKKAISIEDYFMIKDVGNPQISPDGEWIAYVLTTTSLEKDAKKSRIWMVSTSAGEAIPLTAESKSSWGPKWSKDGKWLYFISKRSEQATQLWKLNMVHGGEAIQVTKMKKRGVSSFKFSSDETKLLMVLQDRDPEEIKAEQDTSYVKPKHKPPYVIDRLQFKEDYVGYLNHQRDHIYIYDIPSHKLTQITSGDYDYSSPDWSPDDKWITFASNRTEIPDGNYNEDIWVVAADSTDKGQTIRKLTTSPGEDGSPKWSPDGEWIAYYSKKEKHFVYGLNRLTIIPASGGDPIVLSEKHDRNVSSFRWSTDSKKIYGIFEDHGMQNLVSFDIQDGSMDQIIDGKRVVSGYDISESGLIAAKISEPTLPYEIYALESGELKKITKINDELLSGLQLSQVETIKYKSVDDWDIEGFIYKPIGYEAGKKYPTILRIHGGPMSQYNYGFAFHAQLFAANGYVVVMANPRGSTGYGEEFGLGIMKDWGNKDYQDVMNGVDHAIEKGYADPERLGVGGWSYGGILTNQIITQTPRFKAATTGASATLAIANYGHDMYQRWYEYEYGLPWEDNNRDYYEKQSPLNRVAKIQTPTLILCGEKDWNVPVINSEILYQSLKRLGIDTELIVYPGQSHGGFPPSYNKDLYERYLAWFNKYLKYFP
jgi:dipeptidyl aminopeptidase/acylaminoacyl peptidase